MSRTCARREAALTGESVPSDKSVEPVSAKATVGDRKSMTYSGTLVVSGRATGRGRRNRQRHRTRAHQPDDRRCEPASKRRC